MWSCWNSQRFVNTNKLSWINSCLNQQEQNANLYSFPYKQRFVLLHMHITFMRLTMVNFLGWDYVFAIRLMQSGKSDFRGITSFGMKTMALLLCIINYRKGCVGWCARMCCPSMTCAWSWRFSTCGASLRLRTSVEDHDTHYVYIFTTKVVTTARAHYCCYCFVRWAESCTHARTHTHSLIRTNTDLAKLKIKPWSLIYTPKQKERKQIKVTL